jgi:hypothetical protein
MTRLLIALAIGLLMTGLARAQIGIDIDGLFVQPYNVQAFDEDTTLTITPTPTPAPPFPGALTPLPASVSIDERDFTVTGPGFHPNRHDLSLSTDEGGTAHLFDLTTESLDVSMDITLEAGSDSPRKEAGFLFESPTGIGFFIVNTDANEIAAFSNPFPFYSFNDSNGLSYTNGDTINMRIKYTTPERDDLGTITAAGIMEYIVDVGDGPVSSGDIEITNIEQSLFDNTTITLYLQGGANDTSDFMTATFANFDFGSTDNADFNDDGDVDGHDFLTWQTGNGTSSGAALADGDANRDEAVNGDDLTIWQGQFGTATTLVAASAVPEPTSIALAGMGILALMLVRRQQGMRKFHSE